MDDGGSKILGYYVEKKERNTILWTKACRTLLSATQYKVRRILSPFQIIKLTFLF